MLQLKQTKNIYFLLGILMAQPT